MPTNEMTPDEPLELATKKKPYEKPSFRYEQVFVTTALNCGKIGGQSQCGLHGSS